jgi:tetratricopeptide (TPR) repeat protein/cold shock CspA family protein
VNAQVRLSRARLFAVLDAFERDMRGMLELYVLDHLSEEIALGPDFAKADELRASDAEDEDVPIVHYLYLRQCYDALNQNRAKLPGELAEELRQNTGRMDELVPLRNRVMHGRPLRGEDPATAASILNSFQTRHWKLTHETLRRLSDEIDWEPAFETLPLSSERILHNLPLADYDETGLVGRSDEVRKLKALIQKRREPIVTITGEGGIGKTALALEVAYAVVDDPASDFDCVLWVSLKNEVLTASGVRGIESAVHGITGAAQRLGATIDSSFAGSITDLGDALSGLMALVIVDNLESAQGEEVIELYDALPSSVSYLFTSRIGVGQLERRVPLGALKAGDAELLFRKLASARGLQQLLRLSAKALSQVVERLRCSPLAIRWYVLSVEAGKEPVSTLRDQTELIDFCIRNVHEALSPRSKAILTVLDAVDRSVSFDELAVLTDFPLDELRRAAQELGRGAMVLHQPDPNGGVFSRLSLSVAARLFLKTQPGRDSSMSRIQQKEEEYRRSAERRRVNEATRRLGPGVVRTRTAEDEPVVHLLDLALSHSKRGEIAQSQELIARARALNPDYWEVDRVAGFIASTQRRGVEATGLFKAALANAQTNEERAVVSYYLAGHLARKMHDVEAAIEYAMVAHEHFGSDDTALMLGNLRVWNHEFEEGQALLELALEAASGKTYMIAATALVESWRRWAEASMEGRQPADAVDKAFSGFSVGVHALNEGYVDLKLANEVVESANVCIRAMCTSDSVVDIAKVARILTWLEGNISLARGARLLIHLNRALLLLERGGALDAALSARVRSLAEEQPAADGSSRDPLAQRDLVGEVISWAGTYGFIRHPEYPQNVFFHAGSLAGLDASEMSRGAVVSFDAGVDEEGRPKAKRVALVAESSARRGR